MPLPIPLAFLGAPSCAVHSAWSIIVYNGHAGAVPLPVPLSRELGGVRLFVQWALAGEPGYALITTGAARVTLVGV